MFNIILIKRYLNILHIFDSCQIQNKSIETNRAGNFLKIYVLGGASMRNND